MTGSSRAPRDAHGGGATSPPTSDGRHLGLATATALVVASTVGAGIFTTTGFIASAVPSSGLILAVWLIGGLLALAGAVSYAELGSMMPEAGGESTYIARIFGPRWGYLSAVVSICAGFAAPIAGISLSLVVYLSHLVGDLPDRATASAVIVVVSAINAWGVRLGAIFNDVTALLKVVLMVLFVIAGFLVDAPDATPVLGTASTATASSFATALVLVCFAYTGWNASAYVGGELRDPGRLLPLSLAGGTALVTVLYVLMNVVYLRALAPAEMADVADVGSRTATTLFGPSVAALFNGGIVILLLSTIAAVVLSGPRVTLAMARIGELPAILGQVNARGAPAAAVLLQTVVALVMVWTADIDQIYYYVGLNLSLFAGLAVLGVMVLRRREPDRPRPYRIPLYPLPPLLFLGLTVGMIAFSVKDSPTPALVSGGLLLAALLAREFTRAGKRRRNA